MKAAAIGLLAVAFVAIPVNAATLVCKGQLRIPCGPNPYEPPRHGTCDPRPVPLSQIVVQITENRAPPCGTGFFSSCGTVNVSSSGLLIAGQYVRWEGWSVDDEVVYFERTIDSIYPRVRGALNRLTGGLSLNETHAGIIRSPPADGFTFSGTCERRERLF